jgi:RNA polymerase sigma-70 factor (ECF subfamily)
MEDAFMVLVLTAKDGRPSLDARDLDDLVRRSRAGDVRAFSRLYCHYYRVTFGLAYRMLGDKEAAEDATQEIFVRAWRNLRSFRGASRFSTWLHTIAVNSCLTLSRARMREGRRVETLLDDDRHRDFVSDLGTGSPSPPDWERSLLIREALERLPEDQRVVVVLHYYTQYSLVEIASALGLHPNTAGRRLDRAMNRLKVLLGEEE